MSKGKIAAMGELLVEVMRPEADMELWKAGAFLGPYPSGAPGIFISTAARLGQETIMIGGVGRDDFGKCIVDRLSKDKVDLTYLMVNDVLPTGTAHVTYFKNGDRKFIFHANHTAAVCANVPQDAAKLGNVSYFHIMGCSLMVSAQFGSQIVQLMDELVKRGTKVSFDPNVRPEMLKDMEPLKLVKRVFQGCSIFLPGVEELKSICGGETAQEAVRAAFEMNPGLEILALKDGSRGAFIYDRSGLLLNQPVYPVTQVDPTGAGDSFDGAFISSLNDGLPVEEAAKRAAAAGALNVMKFGPMEGEISEASIREMMSRNK